MNQPSRADFLPFALPEIGEEEISEVVECLRSGWITTGPRVRRFEEEFASFIGGSVQAVAVNSATAGLHLALEAAGVRAGDRVLTTPYTFTATAEVARYLGADPLFADIDPHSFNLDPNAARVAAAACDGVRAIIPVHIAGQACDMTSIGELGRQLGVPIIEDAAHALPTTWRGQLVGTLSTATVFSFYATKTLATGEGGMLVSSDADLLARARVMRLHGISRDVFNRYTSSEASWYYEVVAPGFKYNLTDVAAAIGIHQLRKVRRFAERRAQIAEVYTRQLQGLPLRTPMRLNPGDEHAWHLYVLQLDLERLAVGRDEIIVELAREGIGTSVHFIPLHLQPYWRDRFGLQPADFPVATEVYRRAISLPIYSRMTDEEVQRVISAVHKVLVRFGT